MQTGLQLAAKTKKLVRALRRSRVQTGLHPAAKIARPVKALERSRVQTKSQLRHERATGAMINV